MGHRSRKRIGSAQEQTDDCRGGLRPSGSERDLHAANPTEGEIKIKSSKRLITSSSCTLASSRAQALRRQSASTSWSFGAPGSAGSSTLRFAALRSFGRFASARECRREGTHVVSRSTILNGTCSLTGPGSDLRMWPRRTATARALSFLASRSTLLKRGVQMRQ